MYELITGFFLGGGTDFRLNHSLTKLSCQDYYSKMLTATTNKNSGK